MNKYYCTGEVLENGYLKCVVPRFSEEVSESFNGPFNSHIKSLPVAALVAGGKTGWLEGYEERYEVLYSDGWKKVHIILWDSILDEKCRRIVLVKKPEEKSEGVQDLQDQVREHIAQHDLFNWDEALTDNEMTYLENLLLTFCPIFPKGSIGFEKQNKSEDRPKWVKASERLPDDTKKDRPLYIRKTDSYYIGWLSLTRDIWVTINDDFNKNEDIEWLEEP